MKGMRQHLRGLHATKCSRWLRGQTPQHGAPDQSAQTVLTIETALAKAEMDRTTRRDPKNRDHKMSRQEAVALAPNFYLDRYFTDRERS